jgi:hypothetical protein
VFARHVITAINGILPKKTIILYARIRVPPSSVQSLLDSTEVYILLLVILFLAI